MGDQAELMESQWIPDVLVRDVFRRAGRPTPMSL
jgi:hypothetical protein